MLTLRLTKYIFKAMVAKYIVFEVERIGQTQEAVVFSQFLSHAQVASAGIGKPTSAGFCHIHANGVDVWGCSASLGLSTANQDARLIKNQITHPNK